MENLENAGSPSAAQPHFALKASSHNEGRVENGVIQMDTQERIPPHTCKKKKIEVENHNLPASLMTDSSRQWYQETGPQYGIEGSHCHVVECLITKAGRFLCLNYSQLLRQGNFPFQWRNLVGVTNQNTKLCVISHETLISYACWGATQHVLCRVLPSPKTKLYLCLK